MASARLFTVRGRVQGVFFRDSTRRVAESLNLTGYAVNLPNGDVEVFACGDPVAIDKLAEWLHEGPKMANVTAVESREAEYEQHRAFRTG